MWASSRFNTALKYLKAERVSWIAFMSAVINFTNSILGAGLMGIPYAVSRAGLIPGIALLILIAAISGTRENHKSSSFQFRLERSDNDQKRSVCQC